MLWQHFLICSYVIYLLIAYDVILATRDTKGYILICQGAQSSTQRGKQTYDYNKYINKVASLLARVLFYPTKMLPLCIPVIKKRLCLVCTMESWDRSRLSRGGKIMMLMGDRVVLVFIIVDNMCLIYGLVLKSSGFSTWDSIGIKRFFGVLMGNNRLSGPLSSLTPEANISSRAHRHTFAFPINYPHLSLPAIRLLCGPRLFFFF